MSREGGILINNVLLVITAASVLLGTLYPLFLDAMNLGKISVGPPYFNSVFVPLTIPLAVLVGVASLSRWKQDSFGRLFAEVKWALIASVVLGMAIPVLMLDEIKWGAPVGITLAFWITFTSLQNVYQRVANRNNKWQALMSVPRGFYGMTFAHIGVAVFIVGVTLTSLYSIEKDVRLTPGETYSIGGYDFMFNQVAAKSGPNYQATEGHFTATSQGKNVAQLFTQKRTYNAGGMPMTEAGIDAGLFRDLYVSLGEPLGNTGAWSVRLYHKPFIRWIWLGCVFMSIGGLLAATDRRYRMTVKAEQKSTVAAEGAA